MVKVTSWGTGLKADEAAKAEGTGFSEYDGPCPPKGAYRMRMKFLRLKMNSKGDPMLNALFEIDEPAKIGTKANPKAKYNGATAFWNGNVTPAGAGFVNKFLDALKINRRKFWDKDVHHDNDGEPAVEKKSYLVGTITKIGVKSIKQNEDGPLLTISVKQQPAYQGEDGEKEMKILGFAEAKAAGTSGEDDEDEYEEDEAEEFEEEENEESEEDEDESEEEESDEEFDARVAELEALSLVKLKAVAKKNGAKLADYKALDEDGLIELILEQEFPPEDEEAEEEEAEEEPEEVEEEEEEEEAPAPPARRRRPTAAKAEPAAKAPPAKRAPAATRTRAKAGVKYSKEPPF